MDPSFDVTHEKCEDGDEQDRRACEKVKGAEGKKQEEFRILSAMLMK